MELDRFSRPALVVVDMQNDFVRVGAPLEVPESRPTIPAHQALLVVCRQRRIPVIYTKFLAGPEWTPMWEWSKECYPPVCCCWKGFRRYYKDVDKELDCSDIIDELYPEPTDPIAADRRTDGCRDSLRTSSTPAYPVAPATPTRTGV